MESGFAVELVAGGCAGFAVDVALFPLDTLKTRAQSPQGFLAAGGFRGIYNGLLSAAVGSVPGAALFFTTYSKTKSLMGKGEGRGGESVHHHMVAASVAETFACLVRVPTENVKQKLQAGLFSSTGEAVRSLGKKPSSFYAGYGTTIMREIPFSLIQFPLWEWSKLKFITKDDSPSVAALKSALCGSISGGFAAAVTTPLDVIKTRIMLGKDAHGRAYGGAWSTFNRIVAEEGYHTLFSGIYPRVMWISIGGMIFFAAYERSKSFISPPSDG